ncbi:MAG: lysophospholipid acyltransferase family protein [Verrucomicrobiota bacterium]|jgi:1-acyl-sn-glycerol-3-phosphate acyltransferase
MKEMRRHPFRIGGRFFRLAVVAFMALGDGLFRRAFVPGSAALVARSRWLQHHSRRALKVFNLEAGVSGPVPTRGLLISNHLGYLDILVISSITPVVFVSMRELRFWPAVGWLAQLAGTIFVDRRRRTDVGRVNQAVQAALDSGALVVLFPEGRSSDGVTILPFKSALLEPAARPTQPLTIGCVQYALADGDASQEACYWGKHVFLTHLLNLLGKQRVQATVRFASFAPAGAGRKELARQLRAEIIKLKDQSSGKFQDETQPAGTDH